VSGTIHNRLADEIRRELKRLIKVEYCNVIDVMPHVSPYPGERDFNIVDIKLRDIHKDDPTVYRMRAICLQRDMGNLWGRVYTPRVGDLVAVLFLENEKAIVLGSLPNHFQEPPCRDHDRSKSICMDYLFKWSKWRAPDWDSDHNPIDHPLPQHPDCLRGYHDQRDWQLVFDCIKGHGDPWCQGCKNVDFVLVGSSWFKFISDETDSAKFPKDRIQFHHLSGSVFWFERNSTIYLENRVNEVPKAHIKMCPDGRVEVQSRSAGSSSSCCGQVTSACPSCGETGCTGECGGSGCTVQDGCCEVGARIRVEPDGEIELKNLETDAYIRIETNGEIKLHSPIKITLDAPIVEATGGMSVAGDVAVGDDLTVDDDVTLGGDLSIGGACGSMYVPP